MNELNRASLEASKRLVEAGIWLKTDFYWASVDMENWSLCTIPHKVGFKEYPAPCMAEVWRELPSVFKRGDEFFTLLLEPDNGDDTTIACYAKGDKTAVWTKSANPTDALVDLLIWVRKEADHANT